MKKCFYLFGMITMAFASTVGAQMMVGADWTVDTAVPEGNPVGATTSQIFSGLPAGPITDVSVDLDISGGYNGGLYGYVVLQDDDGNVATDVLLNEMGTSESNPFGSSGAGINVTLSDAGAANGTIHNAPGIPNGVWQPDSPNTLDGTFGGLTANGTWTLYLADLTTGGGTSTLESWGLNISVAIVPESSKTGLICGLGGMAVVVGGVALRNRRLLVSTKKSA